VKLPLREAGHEALRKELARWNGHLCSALLQTEAVRACARYGDAYADQARTGLAMIALMPIDDDILTAAGALEPVGLRTSDAIHLATALSVRDDIGAVLTYGDRLADACRTHGFDVRSPA
jgi:uncharacterized protein